MTDAELLAYLTGQLEYWRERALHYEQLYRTAKHFEQLYRNYAAADQREAQEKVERDK